MSQLNTSANTEELLKQYDSEARTREYIGIMAKVVTAVALIWALFQIYVNSFGVLEAIKMRAWHLGFLLILTFLLYPANKKKMEARKLPTVWDMTCILLTLYSVGYLLITYDTFARERAGFHVEMDYLVGA